MKWLAEDKEGFRYYLKDDGYVYQFYPDEDWFINGEDMRDKSNGWFCSKEVWDRTLHKIISIEN